MPPSRIREGVRAGLVASASTAGALAGFGLRQGDWAGAFSSLGAQVLSVLGAAGAPHLASTLLGTATHAAWMVAWGVCFAALSHGRERAAVLGSAILIGVTAAVTATSVVPSAMGAVRYVGLPASQAALCIVMMTGGLLVGRMLAGAD